MNENDRNVQPAPPDWGGENQPRDLDPRLEDFQEDTAWISRAGRRTSREKLAAGFRGLKHAIRGDSSFFAHGYRGTFIALAAAILSVDPLGWCFLVISATLVLTAELTHSAVDNLARASGDPESPPFKMAREIGAAVVLVAGFGAGALTTTVLAVKFGEHLGWWGR